VGLHFYKFTTLNSAREAEKLICTLNNYKRRGQRKRTFYATDASKATLNNRSLDKAATKRAEDRGDACD